MTELNLNPDGNRAVLELSGEWPPGRAEELRATLAEALARAPHLVVRMAGVGAASLPFYQLLYAARRTALAQGRRLSLEGPFPGTVVRGAWVMGILPRTGAGGKPAEHCLLMENSEP